MVWLRTLFGAALALAAGAATDQRAAAEAPIPCGSIYTAAAGDSLYLIAIRAYGRGLFQVIHDANRDTFPNPRKVAIGDVLLIPCLDGTGPRTLREAQELALAGAVEERLKAPTGSIAVNRPVKRPAARLKAPAESIAVNRPVRPPAERQIRFLTGSGFAPFADDGLEDARRITERLQQAVRRAAPGRDFRVTFINDWAKHQSVLLRNGDVDVGFPWFMPDCSRSEGLADELRIRCDEFAFSVPISEVTIGFYAGAMGPQTAGGTGAGTGGDDTLSGKIVCRPRENFPFDLEHGTLAPVDVSIEAADTAADCFARLTEGQADFVALVRQQANAEIRRAGMTGKVREIGNLASRLSLHAVVLKSNPNGLAYLAIINAGFTSLIASGN